MTNSTIRTIIAAAALTVAVTTASAQTYRAEVPLSFRAGDAKMLPGEYELKLEINGASPKLFVRNLDTHTAVITLATFGEDAPKTWRSAGKPVLAFECTEGSCVLSKLYDGANTFSYAIPHRAVRSGETKLSLITLMPVKSE